MRRCSSMQQVSGRVDAIGLVQRHPQTPCTGLTGRQKPPAVAQVACRGARRPGARTAPSITITERQPASSLLPPTRPLPTCNDASSVSDPAIPLTLDLGSASFPIPSPSSSSDSGFVCPSRLPALFSSVNGPRLSLPPAVSSRGAQSPPTYAFDSEPPRHPPKPRRAAATTTKTPDDVEALLSMTSA